MKGAVLNGALCTMDREAQKADSCFSGSAFDPLGVRCARHLH